MTAEQERWAEALAIFNRYGEQAGVHIAERVGALARTGDEEGVERWRAIAARYDQLVAGTMQ